MNGNCGRVLNPHRLAVTLAEWDAGRTCMLATKLKAGFY